MITLKNPSVTSEWIIDLKEYSQVENSLPMTGLNVRNDSNIVAYVDLDGLKIGEVQRYSADPFQGRNFSLIRIYNPDGQDFAPDDLFIQATKGEVMGSQPFNPQWDMMSTDLDRFATGTDSRISISDVISADMVKYWINTQNSTIVQRRIDIQAHATLLGDYSIAFSDKDIIFGAVGIGTPPPPDTTQYKKVIVNSIFDYSLTNTLIAGWMIDYKTNPNDISDDYTVIAGGADALKTYDDDMSTYHYYSKKGTTWSYPVVLSFSSRSISNLHCLVSQWISHASYRSYIAIQLEINSVWTTIFSSDTNSATAILQQFHSGTGWDLVTGVRLGSKTNTAGNYYSRTNLRDITIY